MAGKLENNRAASLRIAFVQDALPYWGGAEQVLSAALEVFPQAEVYTLIYRREAFAGTPLQARPVHTSGLDRWPGARRHHQVYLPLMPFALERLDLSGYQAVLSFSYAVAHAAPTRPDQLHLSYMHTPLRYAWRGGPLPALLPVLGRLPALGRPPAWLAAPLLALFRRWDRAMAHRTDRFLANSRWMAGRIQAIYGRPAQVLYPPVDTQAFRRRLPRQAYYLYVGRLAAHKRLDLLVEAFNRLGLPLWIAGTGPEEARLRAAAAGNVRFLGWQPPQRLAGLLAQARAFVHAGEEDFGIAMAEAQAAGCPVIALGRGGAAEIVQDGWSGRLFAEQSAAAVCAAVEDFERHGVVLSAEAIQAGARRFDRAAFRRGLRAAVYAGLAAQTQSAPGPAAVPATFEEQPGRAYG